MKKILRAVKRRKKISAFGAVIIIGGSVFVGQVVDDGAIETRYVLSAVETGTLVTTVTGTGQVQGLIEIGVAPEVSGKLISIAAQNGGLVEQGEVIATIDSTTYAKSVRDARWNLESAKLSYQKLTQTVDTLSLLQAQNALAKAQRTLSDLESYPSEQEVKEAENAVVKAERSVEQSRRNFEEVKVSSSQDLVSSSENGYSTVAEAFTKLSSVKDDLADFVGTESIEYEHIGYYDLIAGSFYTEDVLEYYVDVEESYNDARVVYSASNYDSDIDTKTESIELTLKACRDIANTLNAAQTLLNKIHEEGYSRSAIRGHIDEMTTIIPGDISIVNNLISSLQSASDNIFNTNLSAPNKIASAQDSVDDAEGALTDARTNLADVIDGADPDEILVAKELIEEKLQQLKNLMAGTDELELRSSQLSVQERNDALNDAIEDYAECEIRAPFSGKIADLSAYVGQSVSSSGEIATIVSDKMMVSISLNEVDIAKVHLGDRANVTFDAIEDLSITGEVFEIDIVGSTSSGVVNYGVLISLDTQDQRVLSGMSISVIITTQVVQDALVVPSSAVKTQGDIQYVETIDGVDTSSINPSGVTSRYNPKQVVVEVGLSNDIDSQILSGLSDGEIIITRTITDSKKVDTSSSSLSAQNIFSGSGKPLGDFVR
jgi:multidrug efflux pump subunit AcrA (membrane-fusion protein)